MWCELGPRIMAKTVKDVQSKKAMGLPPHRLTSCLNSLAGPLPAPYTGPIMGVQKKMIAILGGLLTLALFLEGALQISSFFHRRRIHSLHQQKKKRGEKNSYTIVCLGDSMTSLGEAPPYPQQLEEMLAKKFPHVNFSVVNLGIPGTNSGILLANLDRYLEEYRPDLVVSMIGNSDELLAPTLKGSGAVEKISLFFQEKVKLFKLIKLFGLHLSFKWHELTFTDRPQALKREGRIYFNRGDIARAEVLLKKSLKEDAQDAEAYHYLIELYYFQKDFVQAKHFIKLAVEHLNSAPQAFLWLNEIYRRENHFAQNEKEYLELIDKKTTEAGLIYLGRFYEMFHQTRKAEASYLRALELHPQSYFVHLSLADLYRALGQEQKAVALYQKCLQLSPQLSPAYFGLGMLYTESGQAQKARPYLEMAAKTDSYFTLGHKKYLAYQLQQQGEQKRAQELLQEVGKIRLEQYNPATVYNYRALVEKVQAKKIPIIAMQYPNRDLFILQEILKDRDPIFFLGNEDNFAQALKTQKFAGLFVDNFAGDLGHLSRQGHFLVASRLFNFIVDKVFVP